MFRESANSEHSEDSNAMLPLAISISRNLHSLFVDRPDTAHDDVLWMNNTVMDHYHRPAAGGGGGNPSYSATTRTTDPAAAADTDDNSLDQVHNQTLSFVLIFLSFMVLYIGFCMYYRKLKFRRSYDDESPNSANSRQQRQRDNQAVLNESSSRAIRAAVDREEQRKLEERKRRIGEVLWTKLIVDDEVETVMERGHDVGDDEENQVNEMRYLQDEEMGSKKVAAALAMEGRTLAQDEDAATAAAAGMLVKQDEETEEVPSNEETTIATVPSSSEGTIATIPSNEVVSTNDTSPSSSSTVATSTPPSSPFRKYADALSCNSCHNHSTNYCSNHITCNSGATQTNDATTSSSPSGNNKSSTSNPSSSLTTITLSDIQQTYGDECNICLSTFQVGDRAAWSKHHFNGCVHAFHHECMKRWLLVRDGCPICRRLYLGGGTKLKSVVPAPHDDEGANGVNGDGGMESERDLESGVGGNAIITIEEE